MAYTTIDDPTLYFNTKLYTGTGSELAITGVGFQPDWVWSKNRDQAEGHRLFDSVRGVTKFIRSNNTDAEGTAAQTLKSFDSDGVTIGTDADMNTSSEKNVLWNWKAGTTSVPSGGSITPSAVSINVTSGFGIYKYQGNGTSGATIAHGLGTTPKVFMCKRLSNVDALNFYHGDVGNTSTMRLDRVNAPVASSTYYNNTSPTSTLITLGNETGFNENGNDYVMYTFCERKGYSKFGSYIGNQNVDGTFVYLGFKPAFVMVKRTDSTSDWLICDNKRDPHNGVFKKLFPNLSQGDDSYISFDFISNGFKIRSAGTGHNASGSNMIYMAFAENPFVTSTGIPTTAR